MKAKERDLWRLEMGDLNIKISSLAQVTYLMRHGEMPDSLLNALFRRELMFLMITPLL